MNDVPQLSKFTSVNQSKTFKLGLNIKYKVVNGKTKAQWLEEKEFGDTVVSPLFYT